MKPITTTNVKNDLTFKNMTLKNTLLSNLNIFLGN